MGSLTIDHLTKTFDDSDRTIVAVDDLDIEIEDGEFVVFVGPSGCGKTTTLRCIGGLENPSAGDIRLNDVSVIGQPPQSRDIAMVFQDYALYPHMTARENMSFGLKMSTDTSASDIRQNVSDVAEMMGISDLLGKKPGELSGGQQQRVALGRAIVREPEVFLMDEPLSNLDAKLRRQMRTEIQNLQNTLTTTTIYVTHDQTEAMTMGDSIVILNDGELQQHGTPLECYHMPRNRFVAGFVGSPSMNFIECTLVDSTLRSGEFEVALSESLREEIPAGTDDLTLGIRPSDVELATADDPEAVGADVEVTEPLGDQTHLYLTLAGREFVVTVDGERTVHSEEQLHLRFPEEKIHLFEGETGETIRNRAPPAEEAELIQA